MNEPDQTIYKSEQVQCSVTGKWFPEEQLISFQGRRVCPEGKEILLECIRSGREMPGEIRVAPFFRRFIAWLIDTAATWALFIVIFFITVWGAVTFRIDFGPPFMRELWNIIWMFMWLVPVLYWTTFDVIFRATPAKIFFGLYIVTNDGGQPKRRVLFRRALLACWPFFLFMFIIFVQRWWYANLCFGALFLWPIVDSLPVLEDRKNRATIHDLLTKTRVSSRSMMQ